MFSSTAGLAFAVTTVYTGITEGDTVATSPMRTGAPAGVVLITMLAISAGVRAWPLTRLRTSWWLLLDQPGRIDHVAAADGVQNVGNGDGGLDQLGGVGLHLEFRYLPALHDHGRNAGQAVQPRLQFVGGQLPKRALR